MDLDAPLESTISLLIFYEDTMGDFQIIPRNKIIGQWGNTLGT